MVFGGGVCELSESKKKAKYAPRPSFALATLILDFVAVVHGFRSLTEGPKIVKIQDFAPGLKLSSAQSQIELFNRD